MLIDHIRLVIQLSLLLTSNCVVLYIGLKELFLWKNATFILPSTERTQDIGPLHFFGKNLMQTVQLPASRWRKNIAETQIS